MQKSFNNYFLDKILLETEPYEQTKLLRVFGTGLSRQELANFLNIDVQSIRRYESKWNTAKIPQWYFQILRFLSGDLSIFGQAWSNCRICPSTKKLTIPQDKYKDYLPQDLNAMTSFIHQNAQAEIRNANFKIQTLLAKLEAKEKDNELLKTQNDRLQAQLENKRIVKEQIQNSNNIIEFRR